MRCPRVPEELPVEPFKKEELEFLINARDFCEQVNTDRRRKFAMQRSTAKRNKVILLTLVDMGLHIADVEMKTG